MKRLGFARAGLIAAFVATAILGSRALGTGAVAGLPPREVAGRHDPGAVEASKALVRAWVEVWNTGDLDAVDGLLAPGFVRHDPNAPEVHGAAEERQLIAMYRAAFPDLRFTVDAIVAEGDTVAVRLTAVGTHRGELLGIPPTGKAVRVAVMETYRIADGRIAEQWVVMDALGMMQQLGAIPAQG
jgi:steroid delta-isomerase-like uncharacterized protein